MRIIRVHPQPGFVPIDKCLPQCRMVRRGSYSAQGGDGMPDERRVAKRSASKTGRAPAKVGAVRSGRKAAPKAASTKSTSAKPAAGKTAVRKTAVRKTAAGKTTAS